MLIGLDSGAFSIARGKVKGIDIEQYAELLSRKGDRYELKFTFDVMNDGPASYKNWQWLRKQGHDVVPVYHVGTDEKYLERYKKQTDRIAIGAIARQYTQDRLKSLTYIFEKHLLDKNGKPVCKAHGLGLTSTRIMFGYPWFSVDSASALILGGFGGSFMPRNLVEENGRIIAKPSANGRHWFYMGVSTRKGKNALASSTAHFFALPKSTQELYRRYARQMGAEIGDPPRKDVESYKMALFSDKQLKTKMEEDPKNPYDGKIVLTRHWTGRILWNMMMFHTRSKEISGPRIYFVANAYTVRAMKEIPKFHEYSVLTSFARKEKELDRLHQYVV